MITTDEVLTLLLHELLYDEKLVYVIDNQSREILLNNVGDFFNFDPDRSVKIQGMERYSSEVFDLGNHYAKLYNHNGPVTCHLFMANKNSPSFKMHTDPDHVVIHCCEGKKTFIIDDKYIILEAGDHVLIPAGVKHQALNEHDAITLSFGLEFFLKDKIQHELDVLS